MGRIIRNAQ